MKHLDIKSLNLSVRGTRPKMNQLIAVIMALLLGMSLFPFAQKNGWTLESGQSTIAVTSTSESLGSVANEATPEEVVLDTGIHDETNASEEEEINENLAGAEEATSAEEQQGSSAEEATTEPSSSDEAATSTLPLQQQKQLQEGESLGAAEELVEPQQSSVGMEEGFPYVEAASLFDTKISFGGMQWDVVDVDGNGIIRPTSDGAGKVTLLLSNGYFYPIASSGSVQYNTTQWAASGNITNAYAGSILQQQMNNITNTYIAAVPREYSAIQTRPFAANSATTRSDNGVKGAAVNDKLWPLSYNEAVAFTGSDAANASRVFQVGDESLDGSIQDPNRNNAYIFQGNWHLRTPSTASLGNNRSTYVSVDGSVGDGSTYSGVLYASFAVRPAFRLNLASIIFTSAATGSTMKSSVGVGQMAATTSNPENPLKLTMLDSSIPAPTTSTASLAATSGGTISVPYASTFTGAANRYVTAYVINGSGETVAYGKLAQDSASGTVDINLPEELTNGTYSLQLRNEETGTSELFTDFVSPAATISLHVISPPIAHPDIGFGGYQWKIIGNEGTGVATEALPGNVPNTLTVLLASGFDMGLSPFNSGGAGANYANSTLHYALITLENELPPEEASLLNEQALADLGVVVSDALYWPLSTPGAQSLTGSTSASDERVYKPDGSGATRWWLRSSYSATQKWNVLESGALSYAAIDSLYSVRPAANIDLSHILWRTDAINANGKGSVDVGDPAVVIGDIHGDVVKFTASTNSLAPPTKVSASSTQVAAGKKLGITYSNTEAVASGKFVSYVILPVVGGVQGDPLYYGKLSEAEPGSDLQAAVSLPVSIVPGDYVIKLFNERISGDNHTDFASTMVDVPFSVIPEALITVNLTLDVGFSSAQSFLVSIEDESGGLVTKMITVSPGQTHAEFSMVAPQGTYLVTLLSEGSSWRYSSTTEPVVVEISAGDAQVNLTAAQIKANWLSDTGNVINQMIEPWDD